MARNQKNYQYFTYTDDNAVVWNVRGEVGGAGTGIDGATALTAGAPVWGRNTKRRHVRYVEATDPTTFRKVRFIVYTPTAFAAIHGQDLVNVQVAGLATNVGYNVSAKIPEKQPIAAASRNLADA
jgi:hypothetical protein